MEKQVGYADDNDVKMLISGIEELFRRLPVAVYRSAPDGGLLAANPALAALLGYPSVGDLMADVGDVANVYVDAERRSVWLEEIAHYGEVLDFDIELQRRDGSTVWVQDTARAVFDDGSLVYCEGALIDITEKVRARKARDEFVATVSHELRNPIAVMLGLAQELAQDYESFSEDDRREITAVMARQADDASWIIEDLLVAYREDMSQVVVVAEEFDVGEEVQRVLESIEANVVYEPDPSATRVLADRRRTRQILRNLVSNAVRYGGNEIVVSTRRRDDDWIDLVVSDSGPALDAFEAERIFESYQRGSGLLDAKSVGLGLSVARKLAGLMGGEIFYGHDGRFSSFVVTLPFAP
jgi:PAS domain S-box-containing protein